MPFVTFHDELMRAADHVYVVGSVELRDNVAAEQIAGAAGRDAPTLRICSVGQIKRDCGA